MNSDHLANSEQVAGGTQTVSCSRDNWRDSDPFNASKWARGGPFMPVAGCMLHIDSGGTHVGCCFMQWCFDRLTPTERRRGHQARGSGCGKRT